MLSKPTEKSFITLNIALREGRREMGEATHKNALDAIKYLRKQMHDIEKITANAKAEGFKEAQKVEKVLNG